jgi:hypothetical protein
MVVTSQAPSPLSAGAVLHAHAAGEERPRPGGRGPAQHQGQGREQQGPSIHQHRLRSVTPLSLSPM